MVIVKDKGVVKFRKRESDIYLVFKSNQPAIFYDKELKKQIKKEEPVSIEVPAKLPQIVRLYLDLKTFKDSFLDEKDSILFDSLESRVIFYRKGNSIAIKGMDYVNKKAGILYIDTEGYNFVLFLSYLRTFLGGFPVLTYHLDNLVSVVYDRSILTIEDSDIGKIHYIEKDEINTLKEIAEKYIDEGILFNHSFTPDRNIAVTKEKEFIVNDKIFDIATFKKLYYMLNL